VEPVFNVRLFHPEPFGEMMGMAQYPKPKIIFPSQDDWPNGSQDVVKRNGDDSGNLAASEHPREKD
jgi:hypothetical protein